MDISILWTFLPHTDPDASIAFYRDILGFEVRNDVGQGKMRWVTLGPAGQPDVSIVLEPPTPGPDYTDEERRVIASMMNKGNLARVVLATKDLDAVFTKVKDAGGEVVQEPAAQSWGARDCVFRDPSGNLVRINEVA